MTLRIVPNCNRSESSDPAVAALFRSRRASSGNSQADEARIYGVSERTYRRWEYGFGDHRNLLGWVAAERRVAA